MVLLDFNLLKRQDIIWNLDFNRIKLFAYLVETHQFCKTEFWDGSSWTEIGDITARGQQMVVEQVMMLSLLEVCTRCATEEWTAPATFTKQVEGQLFLIQQQTLLKKRY